MSEVTLESQLFDIIRNKEMPENIKLAKIDMLIRLGADLNVKSRGKTSLALAKDENLEKIAEILSENGALDERISDEEVKRLSKRLMVFINVGDLDEAKNAIEEGADVNYIEKASLHYNTPLLEACRHGHIEMVRKLLDCGAELNLKNAEKTIAPIYIAAARGHIHIIKELIKRGADINDDTSQYKLTPLMGAVGDRRYDMVKFLISNGADVNKIDVDGQSALMEAVEKGDIHLIGELIDAGADVLLKDKKGKIALEYTQNEDIKKFLIKKFKKTKSANLKKEDINMLEGFLDKRRDFL